MDDILWFPNLSLKICFVKNEGLTIKVMHVEIRHYNANNDITHNISQSDSVWWVSLISVNEDWIEEEEEEDLFIIISSLFIYVKMILLMCALRAHINFYFWKKFSRELKK